MRKQSLEYVMICTTSKLKNIIGIFIILLYNREKMIIRVLLKDEQGGFSMFEKLGGLFGWLLVWAFIGTILNYCLKLVNKRFGKKISANPSAKKVMKVLMTIFVRNHKYFGLATVVLLLAHFVAQFSRFGINVTGCIAAVIMIIQAGLGICANIRKKPRKGMWFYAHRLIALLLILGIALHLLIPNALNTVAGKESSNKSSSTMDTSKLKVFTAEELAKYNGENGAKAYVAYKGLVYDVSNIPQWKNGVHNGHQAGTDLTKVLNESPHGESVLKNLEIVGKLE